MNRRSFAGGYGLFVGGANVAENRLAWGRLSIRPGIDSTTMANYLRDSRRLQVGFADWKYFSTYCSIGQRAVVHSDLSILRSYHRRLSRGRGKFLPNDSQVNLFPALQDVGKSGHALGKRRAAMLLYCFPQLVDDRLKPGKFVHEPKA